MILRRVKKKLNYGKIILTELKRYNLYVIADFEDRLFTKQSNCKLKPKPEPNPTHVLFFYFQNIATTYKQHNYSIYRL